MELDPYSVAISKTIYQQLKATTNLNVIFSWGLSGVIATKYKEMPALILKVSARLFSGDVIIAYDSGPDYYEIYLKDNSGTRLIADDVDCMQMGDIIDRHIERGDNPEEYDEFCRQEEIKLYADMN